MLSEKIVLIGGGYCKSVLDAVIRSKKFLKVVITDYNIPAGTEILGCPVVGNDEMLPKLFEQGIQNAFITIGSNKSTDKRRDIFLRARKIGFAFPTIIDQSAAVASSSSIAAGVFVGKHAVVNADAMIGSMAIIKHDCRIGEFTHVAVGATICGGAKIGGDVLVGANAVVLQGAKIGKKSIIGAGSIVLGDVPENDRSFVGGKNSNTIHLLGAYNVRKAYLWAGRYAA